MHHLKSKLSKFSGGGPPRPPKYKEVTTYLEFIAIQIVLQTCKMYVPLQIIINIREPSWTPYSYWTELLPLGYLYCFIVGSRPLYALSVDFSATWFDPCYIEPIDEKYALCCLVGGREGEL